MESSMKNTIGEVVAQDFRTASVFSKYGIDFCCKGHRTIEEVCEKKSISPKEIIEKLNAVRKNNDSHSIDYASWPLDLLADYIEKIHHRFIKEKTPVLLQFLNKLCKVHGERHPELFEINSIFSQSSQDMEHHMQKEELVLFPFIKQMVKAKLNNEFMETPHFGSVKNPVAMMMDEHSTEGERFSTIAQLTNNYNPPSDACTTYRVTYAMLEEFQNDLHKHIHLENNILFPKAIALEKTFTEDIH